MPELTNSSLSLPRHSSSQDRAKHLAVPLGVAARPGPQGTGVQVLPLPQTLSVPQGESLGVSEPHLENGDNASEGCCETNSDFEALSYSATERLPAAELLPTLHLVL